MEVFQTRIENDGKIQLPQEVLKELDFEAGDEVQLEIDKKSVRVSLSSYEQRKQAQDFIRKRIKKNGSAVDEFIEERRREALSD
jgi:bifunctional DNA-binding transcriptional regulator/antitoxin component of YhaV-PrlF toxin-antitoxin module